MKVLLGKLVVKFPASVEPKSSLSQEKITGSCPESDESISLHHSQCKSYFNIILLLHLGLPNILFRFAIQNYEFLVYPMLAACPADFFLPDGLFF